MSDISLQNFFSNVKKQFDLITEENKQNKEKVIKLQGIVDNLKGERNG